MKKGKSKVSLHSNNQSILLPELQITQNDKINLQPIPIKEKHKNIVIKTHSEYEEVT
jgi:hypothetical protein